MTKVLLLHDFHNLGSVILLQVRGYNIILCLWCYHRTIIIIMRYYLIPCLSVVISILLSDSSECVLSTDI